jgi:hypothetical protein
MGALGAIDLASLGLSAEALAERQDSIGGSDANILMGGDDARILQLWKEKRGETEPENLTGNLAVMMGSFTEPFNAAWFTKQTGLWISGRGLVAQCDQQEFMRCNLDGLVGDQRGRVLGVWEAKHCGTWESDLILFRRYSPQLHHNMICAGLERAWLSVFRGNADWVMFEAALDPAYAARLVAVERAFWDAVVYGTLPVVLPEPEPEAPLPVGVREVNMARSNLWAHFAGQYIETQLAALWHEQAREGLKELVPDDATRAFGHGVEIRRDKRGALRFSTEKES